MAKSKKQTTHSFDIELAEIYGLNCAIIISYFQTRVASKIDEGKGDGFKCGRTWVKVSAKKMNMRLSYMSPRQISTAISKLEKEKIIISHSFNRHSSDRTKNYAFVHESDWLLHEDCDYDAEFLELNKCNKGSDCLKNMYINHFTKSKMDFTKGDTPEFTKGDTPEFTKQGSLYHIDLLVHSCTPNVHAEFSSENENLIDQDLLSKSNKLEKAKSILEKSNRSSNSNEKEDRKKLGKIKNACRKVFMSLHKRDELNVDRTIDELVEEFSSFYKGRTDKQTITAIIEKWLSNRASGKHKKLLDGRKKGEVGFTKDEELELSLIHI